jgi:hypothetical protein
MIKFIIAFIVTYMIIAVSPKVLIALGCTIALKRYI